MTTAIIITLCTLLLIAYLFDVSSSKTKVPSVILLLLLGWLTKQATTTFNVILPDLSSVLPVLGTIGLILIVLEGSLELELNKSKFPLIKTSFLGSLFAFLASAFLLAFIFKYMGNYSLKNSLINSIPLCVISSAIAIPTVKNLAKQQKEFIIYESSLSDIIGVVCFNFVSLNEYIDSNAFGVFSIQLLAVIIISFVATIGLSLLLSKLDHHVKFMPIILLIILIYAVSKVYHLPSLIFILLFGLFIGNLDELRHIKWIRFFKPDQLNNEVAKFREFTTEAAFLIRALFFLLFGFLIETKELLNSETLLWAIGIVVIIYVIRSIQLKLSKLPIMPLLFVAPRGLITILLFLSININQQIPLVNKSLIIQVIVLSTLTMMLGMMLNSKNGSHSKDKTLTV